MMQKKKEKTTLIRYIVPQDLDQIEYPNIFEIPKEARDITMNDIEQYFPLQGHYIFRFAYKEDKQILFVDWNRKDLTIPVPRPDGEILIKATRVSQANQLLKYKYADKEARQRVNYNKYEDMMNCNLAGYNFDSD